VSLLEREKVSLSERERERERERPSCIHTDMHTCMEAVSQRDTERKSVPHAYTNTYIHL